MLTRQSKAQRSAIMSRIRSANTLPELTVRRLVSRLGFRYHLNDTQLPGKPDLVFRSLQKLIFVHGCFWHGHTCKRGARMPKSNTVYWTKKIQNNQARDKKAINLLRKTGWSVKIVRECELKKELKLTKQLAAFLAA